MNKKQLRQLARNIRAGIDDKQRLRDEKLLAENVCSLLPSRNDDCVIGIYHPIGTEIAPPMDFERAALPVARYDKILEFYEWREGDPLVKRDYDIPIPDTRHKSPIVPDVILAPLLLCDANGNRLGYGKGHYDRYLASLDTKPMLIGVCFEEQIFDDGLPAEDHDAKLDFIVTPKRIIENV